MARMSEFTFLSSDGQTALSAREYLPEGDPVGIVQIVHGIAEHIARYDVFAAFLAEHGYIVVLHDQLSDLNPQYWQFWLGLILVLLVLFARGGILGTAQKWIESRGQRKQARTREEVAS